MVCVRASFRRYKKKGKGEEKKKGKGEEKKKKTLYTYFVVRASTEK
jgi:hypothetical protein